MTLLSVRVSHGLSQKRRGHATISAGAPPKRRFPQAAIVQGGLLVERGYNTPDCMSHPWPFFAPAGIHIIADRKFRPTRNRWRYRHRLRGTIVQLYHRRPQLPTEAAVNPDMLSGKSGSTRLRIRQPGWWGRALYKRRSVCTKITVTHSLSYRDYHRLWAPDAGRDAHLRLPPNAPGHGPAIDAAE